MQKILIFIFFVLLIFPSEVKSQTVSQPQASSSPQLRNKLQLLGNTKLADPHFRRFDRRFKVLLTRIRKINGRIDSRMDKIVASAAVLKRFNSQADKINTSLAAAEKKHTDLLVLWDNILESKDSQNFKNLKNEMAANLKSVESLISEEKVLIKELKKYKSKADPAQKAATSSTLNN